MVKILTVAKTASSPKGQRKVINRLIRLACAEVGQAMLQELQLKKRKWVKDWIVQRDRLGASSNLLLELVAEEPNEYKNVLRMDSAKFDTLLAMVTPKIAKQDSCMRIEDGYTVQY